MIINDNLKILKVVTVKIEEVEQMNPPKYEKCDDMADLTYLNDATVLHNLRERFKSWYIYVIKDITQFKIKTKINQYILIKRLTQVCFA
jgi:hypothetical protein